MAAWTFYKEVKEGERVWRSYRAAGTLGTIYRETISYIDAATNIVKAQAEAVGFVAAPDAALAWSKDSEVQNGERLEQLYSATITGGKMYLSVVAYRDAASGYVRTAAAAMTSESTTDTSSSVVADSITNGVTDVAPSQNAVFDALALKQDASGTAAVADGRIAARILFFDSAASAGGAASEALTVTGLLATDTILSVSQRVPGANGLASTGWSGQANDALTVDWTLDPGAGAIVRVAVLR